MERLQGPVRLDFHDAEMPGRSHGTHARDFVLSDRQRAAAPWPHRGVTIAAATADAAISPRPGATLSIGPFVPRRPWTGAADEQRYTHLLIALTNAKPGREAEFDDWYWSQHFPDGLRLPGCYAGRRYALAPQGAGPFAHLAIYQYDIAEIGESIDELARRSGTPEMPITDAISPVFQAWYIQPVGGWR